MHRLRWFVIVVWLASAAWHVHAATPPVAVLPDEPLASLASRADPVLVIDLALKSANAGAAYRDSFDWTRTYAGYWDPLGCYSYATADGYFKREGTATRGGGGEIACRQRWSGNLLNWAATSAIDGVRLALTGGDRAVDEVDRTVLRRATLPDDFYRSSSFPDKTVTGNLDKLTPLVTNDARGLRATDAVHFNNCRGALFVGPTASGTCDNPGSDQRLGPGSGAAPYLARVEVCTPDEATTRGAFCQKYPNGRRKPVGAVQLHGQRLRLAVFGYLLDNDPARYGGVLRAPLKHTGPTHVDAAFNSMTNPLAEWDAGTGVFKDEPAGIVNGVNSFGNGGAYRRFDPAGELYYESLRYLQGRPPTPEAMTGVGAGNDVRKDGLPVYNDAASWSAENRDGASVAGCQKRRILLIGDADTDHDRSLPGMSRGGSTGDFDRGYSNAAYEPDTTYWTSLVGAFENGESLSYSHPSAKARLSTAGNNGPRAFNDKGGAQLTSGNIATVETGASMGSFGVAGLAYWANTQKIRGDWPDARVQTFAIDMGRGGNGALRQPLRGSAFYLAAKYGGFVDGNDDGNPFRSSGGAGKPDVAGDAEWAEGIDADGQPQASSYALAGEPSRMVAAVRQIFLRAAAPSDFGAGGGALSSDRIAKAGAQLYVPQSDGRRWSGTLLAYPLSYDTATGTVQRGERSDWDAAALLTGNAAAVPPVPARDPASRRIFSLSATGVGMPLQWDALDEVARRHLSATPYAEPAASDALGAERLAYLRGDRRKEWSAAGGVFRVRDSVMGDVAHSIPLAAGSAVYVGANDGMLHAFSARSGEELFAYVPRTLFPGLAAYTSPDYAHKSHADAPPAAGEIRTASGAAQTVLVSGTGGGATGVFALDVTHPAAFAADKVLWEFSGADDKDMGYLTQAPRIMKFRTAAATRTRAAAYRWFAVVPSGFNNANSDGRAALFLLALDKVAGTPWAKNVNYYKVVLPSPRDKTLVNALGVPGDYAGGDGAVRFLYAGDTQGNLWKFDFSGDAPWDEGGVLPFGNLPLMVAMDGHGAGARRQPITVTPVVGVGPSGGAIVLFGTGKFVSPEDLGRASHGLQTVYGVLDNGTSVPVGAARTQLESRQAVAADGAPLSGIAGEAFTYGAFDRKTSSRRGWYFDLPASLDRGERQVFNPVLSDGQLFFNTLIPNASACGGGGGGRSCAVNAMTGLSTGGTCVPSDTGMPGPPLLVQLGEVGIGAANGVGRRSETRRLAIISLGTRGGRGALSTAQPTTDGKVSQVAGRLNWRQVVNHRGAKP